METSYEFPVYARLGMEIAEAAGANVLTSDGRELIDFYGGHAVAALGYRPPRLVARLEEQARRLFFQTNLVEVEVRRKAHEDLARFAPTGMDRVFMVNSGAEANENALRLAFRDRERTRVVAVEGGFHGRTSAAAACSHGALDKWYAFPATPFDVTFVAVDDVKAMEAAIGDDVAAVILEPVQGLAGARDLDPDFLRAARTVSELHGAWLIADEVQCGMGRTGRPFAIEHAGVVPDVITTAKGLGGGFPVGAVIARTELVEELPKGALGTTFGGGPLACAMVSEVVDTLCEVGFIDRVAELGAAIRETCCVGPVVAVQGEGLLSGLLCDRPAKTVLAALRQRGILAGGATNPNVVRLMPPLIIEHVHIDALRSALLSIDPLGKDATS